MYTVGIYLNTNLHGRLTKCRTCRSSGSGVVIPVYEALWAGDPFTFYYFALLDILCDSF